MRDLLSIAATPYGEDCHPAGHPDAREECVRFAELLRNVFPNWEATGARFTVKSNPHDFGAYYEVNVAFNDEDPVSTAFAFHVEEHAPELWTATAADVKQFDHAAALIEAL